MQRVIHGADVSKARAFVCSRLASAPWVPNGEGRRFARFDTAPGWLEAFALFGLVPDAVEPKFGCFIGNHYADGAHTHEHQDANFGDLVHARVNVMIRKPKHGGNPILAGNELAVDEGDVWLCLAGLERHASTPIAGGERVILSYGGLLPAWHLDNVVKGA